MCENDRTGEFFALLFRAKDIDRWGLMRTTFKESLSEHCYETALLTHALALIGNTRFGKEYRIEKMVTAALYHDMSEILTGDLPTPVKYYNDDIKDAYKKIEKNAENILLGLLPDNMKTLMEESLQLNEDEKKLMKAADKLCAYIKCLDELSCSNREFAAAEKTIRCQLEKNMPEEACCFFSEYLDAFDKPLDDITL